MQPLLSPLSRRGVAVLAFAVALAGAGAAFAQSTSEAPKAPANQDPRARALLDEAKARLRDVKSLAADFEVTRNPTKYFDRSAEIFLERPARFRVQTVSGAVNEERALGAISDGKVVTGIDARNFIAYEKPVRPESFFVGQNFLVQLFFDPGEIKFDPSSATFGRPVSVFDTNLSAYDRGTTLTLVGQRLLERKRYSVVEIKYNTARYNVRQQLYIGDDKLIYQVDTYFDGEIYSEKFRNFRIDEPLPETLWTREKPQKMPLVQTDPVRLGETAPDFTLPGASGGEFTLSEMLKGKKGAYICTFDGTAGRDTHNPDYHLRQMRILQAMKEKFEPQGLVVVAIVGGPGITPDLRNEMLTNWLPDLSRFNYPIVIDVDLEKGIQGAAYQNFDLKGRNNLLLDAKGRVVFAARDFRDKVNEIAFYQALAQIGFSVSAADVESVTQ